MPAWTKGPNGTWTAEVSELQHGRKTGDPFPCPECSKLCGQWHLIKTDRDASGEDTYGWHFNHECGAEILVIND